MIDDPCVEHFELFMTISLRGRRKKEREKGREKSLFPYPLPLSTPATKANDHNIARTLVCVAGRRRRGGGGGV